MIDCCGIALPDHESEMTGIIRAGQGTYQQHKFRAVCNHVRRFDIAVDIGAHVGTWTVQMIERFRRTICFEPVPAFRECWDRNVPTGSGAEMWPVALGAFEGEIELTWRQGVSGHTYVSDDGIRQDVGPNEKLKSLRVSRFVYLDLPKHVVPNVPVKTLDSFRRRLLVPRCDLLKIDCEGYELFVLEGAVEFLQACHPVVIVEQKDGMGSRYGVGDTAAVRFLEGLGAKMRTEIGGDFIMSWDD